MAIHCLNIGETTLTREFIQNTALTKKDEREFKQDEYATLP
jgi:hypothetical protein